MKSIHECSREERLERALLAIESLYLANPEEIDIDFMYTMAHSAIGRCCNGGNKEDWLGRIEETERLGKKYNIYDVDEVFKKEIKY